MGYPIEQLSALKLKKLAKSPGVYQDGGGLQLVVTSPTSRSWVYRYMLSRKRREMGLGPYPTISLADARQKAADARKLKANGIDPLEHRNSIRLSKRLEAARSYTFHECAQAYIAEMSPNWRNEKHAKQWRATLQAYAYPVIGDLPIASVDAPLIREILAPIWTTKAETARRVKGRIAAILDWAKNNDHRDGDNPARLNLFPTSEKAEKRRIDHHAALDYGELPGFLATLQTREGNGALALQFAILAAARTADVIEATWDEINLEEQVWTIPKERMKSERDHHVPLSKQTLAILKKQCAATGGEGYVFPGGKRGRPLSNMAMLTTLRRMGRDDLTVHGFRSTFKDWASDQTVFPNEVSEAALAHVIGDKVEAAYRRGDLFNKRARLMKAWASHCMTPRKKGEVLKMRASSDV